MITSRWGTNAIDFDIIIVMCFSGWCLYVVTLTSDACFCHTGLGAQWWRQHVHVIVQMMTSCLLTVQIMSACLCDSPHDDIMSTWCEDVGVTSRLRDGTDHYIKSKTIMQSLATIFSNVICSFRNPKSCQLQILSVSSIC